ncbi:TVP38/TMEM64 family protein [Alkalicoccus urumqiensis]|uniref:TVP38/TMEM64 family membrane protein n=1 Tax=Alkalicoccus urumqiensis TaxID=1548213 RepID=A0A2P6MEI8_ALKUR|nr:TVP38/TMEM64 family protein [Alkalicoccus urumqiensis]PRO64691.1 TVP38/TMEM64 family protein [Alkalicoccus urumqiensis]
MHQYKGVILKAAAVIIIIAVLLYINQRFIQVSPEEIRTFVLQAGVWAPAFYVILYIVRPLVLFPASVLSLAGGLIFGPVWGTGLIVAGATGGAVLSFFAARWLGKGAAGKEWKGKGKAVQEQLEKNGFLYVLLIRLIPIFNFDMISYLSGVSKIRARAFAAGTFLGIIPGAFAYSFLGASVVEGNAGLIFAAVAVFIAVSAIPVFFRKKLWQKTTQNEGEEQHDNL